MTLTLEEIENMTGVSRCQISRYAADGRLQRTSQGHYDASGLANLEDPYHREAGHLHPDEEAAVWRIRSEYQFRRALFAVIAKRHLETHTAPRPNSDELSEIEAAVSKYAVILRKRLT